MEDIFAENAGSHIKPLFIFAMADNHQGDPDRGLEIIRQVKTISAKYDFSFAFKFEKRHRQCLIRPTCDRRKNEPGGFSPVELNEPDLSGLAEFARRQGFAIILTAFDEDSVDLLVQKRYDAVSLEPCSLTDWPLLEKLVRVSKPVFAHTAGAGLSDMEKVHLFFKNRGRYISFMHSIEEYPACRNRLDLNRITLFTQKFPDNPVGFFSTEKPGHTDSIKIALAKGARIFERLVGLDASPDGCSCSPEQIDEWLAAARDASMMCLGRDDSHTRAPLRGLRRGVYAATDLGMGNRLGPECLRLEFPCRPDQLSANDLTKKTVFLLKVDAGANSPILLKDVEERAYTDIEVLPLPPQCSIVETGVGGVPCVWIKENGGKSQPAIINVHGGGFVSGSALEACNFAVNLRYFTALDILNIDYRLAPDHVFPAALSDLLAVYESLAGDGVSTPDIGLFGESAGGGLVLAAVTKMRELGLKMPAAIVCSSPWADLTNTAQSHSDEMNCVDIMLKTRELNQDARLYAGNEPLTNPAISPVFGEFSGFPPLLIYAGTREILVDDARGVAAKALEAGVDVTLRIVEAMPHAFVSKIGIFKEAEKAMAEIGEFFRKWLVR